MSPRKPSRILIAGRSVEPFSDLPEQRVPQSSALPQSPSGTPAASVPHHYAPCNELLVGAGVQIKGEVRNCSRMIISGSFEGTLLASEVLVHRNAVLRAAVIADRVDVFGNVTGEILAAESIHFRDCAVFEGRLVCGELSVEPGASLSGDLSQSPASGLRLASTEPGISMPDADQDSPLLLDEDDAIKLAV